MELGYHIRAIQQLYATAERTPAKPRYRFSHQAGGVYYWYSVTPVDSRHERITCSVTWFWSS